MSTAPTTCPDIRSDVRAFFYGAIDTYDPALRELVGTAVVELLNLNPNDLPFIWFRRTGIGTDDACTDEPTRISQMRFAVEICGDSARDVDIVNRLETAIFAAVTNLPPAGTGNNFGSRKVQLVEISDVEDNYAPFVESQIEGCYWTAFILEMHF